MNNTTDKPLPMARTLFVILMGLLMILPGCREKKPSPPEPVAPAASAQNIPAFNADSAFAFVAAQTDFGPRVPGTTAHAQCASYLESTLKRFTPHVTVQPFASRAWNNQILSGKNIIGTFNPDARKRILLCAHWDSRPYADHDPDPANHRKPIDGANDGASGVGALLEIARLIHENPLSIGIDIIFFDLEDYGEPQDMRSNQGDNWALGSQYWARTPHIPGYRANFGILLDMVGGQEATFYMEGTSMAYAPEIMKKVWRNAHQLGYAGMFVMQESNPITDDHLYINKIAGIPTIDIIQHDPTSKTGFFKYWHTINDNISNIDPNTLKAVGRTVLQTIYTY
jgi:Zn-dependent M28 family amino/carboxypeptidase